MRGGVNLEKNFLGLRTMQTAAYGWIELGIKVAPLFALIYGFSNRIILRSLFNL